MANTLKYPLGIQSFSEIIEGGYVYVDKTEYVYNMTHYSYVFLSRPYRFGKSLLVSTLKSYFEGRKDLFKGLAIEKLEKDWIEYPVILLDLSGGKHLDKDALERYILTVLDENAKRLGVTMNTEYTNVGLIQLIQGAYDKYGQKVVLLIDSYDAPLLDVVSEEEKLKQLTNVIQNLVAPIKDCDEYLRFVFLTGITKYPQSNFYSGLNNLTYISMYKEYAGICGITEEEMLSQLDAGVEALAEKQGLTKDEAVKALKENYGGYHFTWPSPELYNPSSLLNALDEKSFESHRLSSCMPSYLTDMMRKFNVTPSSLCSSREAIPFTFDTSIEQCKRSILPLLYQGGYTTIKECDTRVHLYTLDVPNREVRGLFETSSL